MLLLAMFGVPLSPREAQRALSAPLLQLPPRNIR